MHSFSISDSTYHLCTPSLKSYRPLFCHYPSTTFLLHTPTITTPSILSPLPLPSKPQVPWHHSSLPPAQQTNTRPKRLPLLHPPCFRPRLRDHKRATTTSGNIPYLRFSRRKTTHGWWKSCDADFSADVLFPSVIFCAC